MSDTAIAFICSNYNKYSVSALAGALESASKTESLQLYFLSVKKPEVLGDEISALLGKHGKVAVCFSFATTNIIQVHKLVTVLRSKLIDPRITYIAGGPHATGDPEGTLALGFDIVVIGEAEESFPELVSSLSNGPSFSDLRAVKGVAYVENGAIIKTGGEDRST
ncbi:MAG: cobalamin B12-binding domain-containing protein [Actinobacteria bacterium]|nr:cobalamin B12-binding domain-containing protein [Actinomycetota bacterium]